jgi:hypothetical protein
MDKHCSLLCRSVCDEEEKAFLPMTAERNHRVRLRNSPLPRRPRRTVDARTVDLSVRPAGRSGANVIKLLTAESYDFS